MADTKTQKNDSKTNNNPPADQGKSGILQASGNTDNNGQKSGAEGGSFLDTLYEKITDVIGGDNPNQYFCLTLPGTLVESSDYEYDIAGEKPPHVKASESKLVNKLFDACFITASDNGRHLQNQYRTALNMLSPKLNRDLFEMKVRLREVLMTPYQYDFGDGTEDTMTLEQVFYRLYSEYVAAKAAWNQKQADKKAELKRTIIEPNERRDAYLEWYGLVAEAELVILEEKLGKVLNVFSPGDMNIINSILNCGVGGEIESARSVMNMVEELNPDGGYVYPVNLYPKNWFTLLDSSFTGVDLLESPAALSQRMRMLEMQRSNILLNITKLTSTIPEDKEVHALSKAYKDAEDEFKKLADKCVADNMSVSTDILKTIVTLCNKNGDKLETPTETEVKRVTKDDKDSNALDAPKLIQKIGDSALTCFKAQAAAVDAAEKSTDAALKWCEANNKLQLKKLLDPLKEQLASVNSEIDELKEKITLSKAVLAEKTANDVADVMPNKASDGFTQVLIQSKMSSVSHKSTKESEASASSWGVSFLFGGYSSNKSHQQSVENSMDENSDMEIQIGMNVAKVQIEREWFDPGIFLLTNNMYNFSSNKIAPDNETSFANDNADAVRKRFEEMNECIFPAYPVSFVIAKDVSIRFTSQKAMSSSFAESIEDHASQGGGFLIFSGNSSSSTSSSQSASTANSNANSVTVRFTAPQILGYYMQATPADKSVHINSTSDTDMSVIGFVSKFKEMIEEYNRTLKENKRTVSDPAGTKKEGETN